MDRGGGQPALHPALDHVLDVTAAELPRVEVAVLAVSAELAGVARQVVAKLRARGIAAETPYGVPKLGKALRAADDAGAGRALIVGPEEWKERTVLERDLKTGAERKVAFDEL